MRTGRAYLDEGRAGGGVLALAHRGGPGHAGLEGLENTLEAFRHAVSLGYRYLETDVHATADGMLVAAHDATLERVAGLRSRIGDLRWVEVRSARVGGRAAVPTLAELFDELPEARFNIDLKSGAAVDALAGFLDARRAHDRVLVGAFSEVRMQRFRRLTAGRVATAATPAEVAAVVAVPPGRLGDRVAGRATSRLLVGDALQVPRRRGPVPVVTAAFVRRAHAAGRHVHVWTVDEAAEMHVLLDLGVDGLFTDRTDVLKAVLLERGQWREDAA